MPPNWTDVTVPTVASCTVGRILQTRLRFNAFWGGSTLRPSGAIAVSCPGDMGVRWTNGNGGQDLEEPPTAPARQAGHVEDRQWIALRTAAVAAGRRGPAGDARQGPEDHRLGYHALRRHVRL